MSERRYLDWRHRKSGLGQELRKGHFQIQNCRPARLSQCGNLTSRQIGMSRLSLWREVGACGRIPVNQSPTPASSSTVTGVPIKISLRLLLLGADASAGSSDLDSGGEELMPRRVTDNG